MTIRVPTLRVLSVGSPQVVVFEKYIWLEFAVEVIVPENEPVVADKVPPEKADAATVPLNVLAVPYSAPWMPTPPINTAEPVEMDDDAVVNWNTSLGGVPSTEISGILEEGFFNSNLQQGPTPCVIPPEIINPYPDVIRDCEEYVVPDPAAVFTTKVSDEKIAPAAVNVLENVPVVPDIVPPTMFPENAAAVIPVLPMVALGVEDPAR